MTVKAEVWPVAADAEGIWLLSGHDAWRSEVIMADSSIHFEVEQLLSGHGIHMNHLVTLHSTGATEPGPHPEWTSWRPNETSVIHTYVAALSLHEIFARDLWPNALPLTLALFEKVKPPLTHGVTEEPVPRYVDVLFHALRHLRQLEDTNGENAEQLGQLWHQHLEPFEPALARMYHARHQPTA